MISLIFYQNNRSIRHKHIFMLLMCKLNSRELTILPYLLKFLCHLTEVSQLQNRVILKAFPVWKITTHILLVLPWAMHKVAKCKCREWETLCFSFQKFKKVNWRSRDQQFLNQQGSNAIYFPLIASIQRMKQRF